MPLVLDTCTLVWLATDDSSLLSAAAQRALSQLDNTRLVSVISLVEIHRLIRKQAIRLSMPDDVRAWFEAHCAHHRISILSITSEIADRAELLPLIHKDPADRFIIATAQVLGASIITPDALIPRYPGVQVIW